MRRNKLEQIRVALVFLEKSKLQTASCEHDVARLILSYRLEFGLPLASPFNPDDELRALGDNDENKDSPAT